MLSSYQAAEVEDVIEQLQKNVLQDESANFLYIVLYVNTPT